MGIYDIFKWVYSFENEAKVDLHETVSDLKNEVLLNKNERGLFFILGYPHFKLLYNENSNFIISDNFLKIRVNHFLANGNNQNITERICNSYMFQSIDFDEEKKMFHQYFSKIENYFFISFFSNWQKEFTVLLNGKEFLVSTCQISDDIKYNFLCIECNEKIDFKNFKQCINSIIFSIGFLTGYLYKKEEFFYQSEFSDFSDSEFFYRNQNKRFNTYQPFLRDPQNYSEFYDDQFRLDESYKEKFSSSISVANFQKLIDLIYFKPAYYSSIRMLFEIIPNSFVSKHSILFVVLETISREIRKEFHSEHIDKIIIRDEAFEELRKIKDKISIESFEILSNAIDSIEEKKAKNIVDFELAFSSLKIKLTDIERKSLKRRNNILHGRIIDYFTELNFEEDYEKLEIEYNFFSYKLYTLICKLVLKQIDFDGYLLNHTKLYTLNKDLAKNESYFIKL